MVSCATVYTVYTVIPGWNPKRYTVYTVIPGWNPKRYYHSNKSYWVARSSFFKKYMNKLFKLCHFFGQVKFVHHSGVNSFPDPWCFIDSHWTRYFCRSWVWAYEQLSPHSPADKATSLVFSECKINTIVFEVERNCIAHVHLCSLRCPIKTVPARSFFQRVSLRSNFNKLDSWHRRASKIIHFLRSLWVLCFAQAFL